MALMRNQVFYAVSACHWASGSSSSKER